LTSPRRDLALTLFYYYPICEVFISKTRLISFCSELFNYSPCYSLDGIGFQMTWNIVPDDMEQESR